MQNAFQDLHSVKAQTRSSIVCHLMSNSNVRIIYVYLGINRRVPRFREKTARPMCKLTLDVKYRRNISTIDTMVLLDTKRGKGKSPVVTPNILLEIL